MRIMSESPCRHLRILIVDDNRDAADGLAYLITLWGHESLCVYDAAAAFALVIEHHPDVVLSDLAMPELDGMTLAQMIRQQPEGPQPLLVAVTGFADDVSRRRAYAAGFDRFFVKPLDPIELHSLLLEQFPVDENRPQDD
jgi:CheY-like chemotaxis protein